MIRIGFDAKRAFQNHTGLGVYSRNLLKELISKDPFELFLFTPKITIPFIASNSRIHIIRPPFLLRGILAFLWRSFFIICTIGLKRLDIYHGLSGELPFGIGWLKKTKKIVTIHDVLFKRFPNDYPILDRFFYNWKTTYAIQQADIIIAVSEATKLDLLKYYNSDPSKIVVVENTVDPSPYQNIESQSTVSLPHKYICQIATFLPRKNQLLTIQSFIEIADQVDFDLLLVGAGKKYYDECLHLAKSSAYSHRIHFINRVAQDQLISIYQKAWINVYPSLYEGFGIPIIEAMACQCPNIISNVLPLKEVAGEAAMTFDLNMKGDLATKILELNHNAKKRLALIEKGTQQIIKYSPERIYPKLLDCYYTQELNNI